MTTHALVVAAGRGTRAGPGGPKQYRDLAGRPVLARTLLSLAAAPGVERLRVVIHPDDREAYRAAAEGLALPLDSPVEGGATRQISVLAGLEALAAGGASPDDIVLIHDAARPFAPAEMVEALIAALGGAEAACPALPLTDTIRRAENGLAAETLPREALTRAQTPQAFRLGAILAAHRAAAPGHTDDVAVAQAAGLAVRLTEGAAANVKLTTQEDFAEAEARLRAASLTETRTGTGFDVHAFAEGAEVILCGVAIPHPRGLAGHSDADVGMHALTDAIFGALAEGDIGRWFPPSDPQWKGAPSRIFLEKAAERIAARGGRLVNADVTLICERPKIGPHSDAMRATLAGILKASPSRISVKATTTERLGFAGRQEGIAAQAVVSLSLPASDPCEDP